MNIINLTEQNRQLSFQLSVRLASVIEDLLTWQIFDVRNRDVLKLQVVAPISAFPYRRDGDLGHRLDFIFWILLEKSSARLIKPKTHDFYSGIYDMI